MNPNIPKPERVPPEVVTRVLAIKKRVNLLGLEGIKSEEGKKIIEDGLRAAPRELRKIVATEFFSLPTVRALVSVKEQDIDALVQGLDTLPELTQER